MYVGLFIVLLYFVLLAFSGFSLFLHFSFSTLILLVGLLTCKTVSQITYTVLVETLYPAQSINQSLHSVGLVLIPVAVQPTFLVDIVDTIQLYTLCLKKMQQL